MANVDNIKKLRELCGAGIMDCRKALDQSGNDFKKAEELIKAWGIKKAEKKAGREVKQGLVEAYVHCNGKVSALVSLLCETDFVARTDDFKNLAHEIAMHVAAMNPKDVRELLKQEYIRDSKVTIEQLIKQVIGKVGENIVVKDFKRLEI
jgi:elongation factor Ts